MSGLVLCGKTTEHPLYVEDVDKYLYSMEELCYYLFNNIYMVGPEFFNDALLDFLEKEMARGSLADKLRDQIARKLSYVELAKTIIGSSGYYNDKEKKEVYKILDELADKSMGERIKKRADLLMYVGKYASALINYRQLVNKSGEVNDDSLTGAVWNNMGVIYEKMFMYKDAVACFRLAYETFRKDEFLDNLICAAIFADEEYKNTDYIKEIVEQYSVTMPEIDKYKKAIELAYGDAQNSEEVQKEMENIRYDSGLELDSYYTKTKLVVDGWKKTYREQMQ